jgi:hypothetical protein
MLILAILMTALLLVLSQSFRNLSAFCSGFTFEAG